jgi:hypothetical protein
VSDFLSPPLGFTRPPPDQQSRSPLFQNITVHDGYLISFKWQKRQGKSR